jgi:uncharacterized repeat protein (TIGR02543 family)
VRYNVFSVVIIISIAIACLITCDIPNPLEPASDLVASAYTSIKEYDPANPDTSGYKKQIVIRPNSDLYFIGFSVPTNDSRIKSVQWKFNDGTTTVSNNTKKVFKNTGIYKPVFSIFDQVGNIISDTISVIVNTPPDSVILQSPSDSAINVSLYPKLIWNGYKREFFGAQLTYNLTMITNSDTSTVTADSSNILLTKPLKSASRYEWYVTAFDTHGDSVVSASSIFTTTSAKTLLLNSIKSSAGILLPAFTPTHFRYSDTVSYKDSLLYFELELPDTSLELYVNNETIPVISKIVTTREFAVLTNKDTTIAFKLKDTANQFDSTEYIITVHRQSFNAQLKQLKLSHGKLMPSFAPDLFTYTDTIPSLDSVIVITAVPEEENAIITLNDSPLLANRPSPPIKIETGITTIAKIRVQGSDSLLAKEYTVNIYRLPLSDDANLKQLSLFALNQPVAFPFVSSQQEYSHVLSFRDSIITLKPMTYDSSATIAINDTIVKSGTLSRSFTIPADIPLTINITVTAANNQSTKTYTMSLSRNLKDNDAYLKSLSISQGRLQPEFNYSNFVYFDTIAYKDSIVNLTASSNNPNSIIIFKNKLLVQDSISEPCTLRSGIPEILKVNVTSANRQMTKEYLINVFRQYPDNNTRLSGLSITPGNLSPLFNDTLSEYITTVQFTDSIITVTPSIPDKRMLVTVNGIPVQFGKPAEPVTVSPGTNVIPLIVTAANGFAKDTILIKANRLTSLNEYALYVNSGPGKVTITPQKDKFTSDDSVTLEAINVDCHEFANWSGANNSTNKKITLYFNDSTSKTVTANYRSKLYRIKVSSNRTDCQVKVYKFVPPFDTTDVSNQLMLNCGDSIILKAIPATGYHFYGWQGSINDKINPHPYGIHDTVTVQATFGNKSPKITFASKDTVNGSENSPINLTCTFFDEDQPDLARLVNKCIYFPQGSKFTLNNDRTGTFTWTPVHNSPLFDSLVITSKDYLETVTKKIYFKLKNIPQITIQKLYSDTLCQGASCTLKVVANGTGSLFYEWRKNQTALPASAENYGVNDTMHIIKQFTGTDAGEYDCVVKNDIGAVNSNRVYLTYSTSPVIQTNTPQTDTLFRNTPHTITISATGPHLKYEWYKKRTGTGDSLIRAFTTEVFSKKQIQYIDSGTYYCKVSNTCGEIVSRDKRIVFKCNVKYVSKLQDVTLKDTVVSINSLARQPAVASHSNYRFGGWFRDAQFTNSWNFSTKITSDTTIYAKWDSTFTINYYDNHSTNGKVPVDTNTYINLQKALVLSDTNLVKTGYIYAGWNTSSGGTDINYNPGDSITIRTSNVQLFAKWALDTFTIDYQIDLLTTNTENPLRYTIETPAITFAEPVKAGFIFNGWFSNAELSGTMMNTLPSGSTGNLILWPKWVEEPVVVPPSDIR